MRLCDGGGGGEAVLFAAVARSACYSCGLTAKREEDGGYPQIAQMTQIKKGTRQVAALRGEGQSASSAQSVDTFCFLYFALFAASRCSSLPPEDQFVSDPEDDYIGEDVA